MYILSLWMLRAPRALRVLVTQKAIATRPKVVCKSCKNIIIGRVRKETGQINCTTSSCTQRSQSDDLNERHGPTSILINPKEGQGSLKRSAGAERAQRAVRLCKVARRLLATQLKCGFVFVGVPGPGCLTIGRASEICFGGMLCTA